MNTVRERVVRRFESAIRKREADETLGDALYVLFRTASEIETCVDGWTVFRVMRESTEYLEAVGLMALLPCGQIPIAISITANADNLAWLAQVGQEDDEWRSLSESKRWKKVYIYASGSTQQPSWSWKKQYRGLVSG